MAFYGNILSFHLSKDRNPTGSKLLLVQKISQPTPHTIRFHSHPFWQLEICLKGEFLLDDGESIRRIPKGNFAVIPPGISHQIEYHRRTAQWLTIKFEFTNSPDGASIHVGGNETAPIVSAVMTLLTDGKELFRETAQAVEAMLAGLIRQLYANINVPQKSSSAVLTNRIIKQIENSIGQPMNIISLAEQLHFSVNHITTTFKRSTGQTLKNFIDAKRFEYACRLLRLTNFSISEIAYQMGFNDVFSFSRFFKRMYGRSPKTYRNDPHAQPAGKRFTKLR